MTSGSKDSVLRLLQVKGFYFEVEFAWFLRLKIPTLLQLKAAQRPVVLDSALRAVMH